MAEKRNPDSTNASNIYEEVIEENDNVLQIIEGCEGQEAISKRIHDIRKYIILITSLIGIFSVMGKSQAQARDAGVYQDRTGDSLIQGDISIEASQPNIQDDITVVGGSGGEPDFVISRGGDMRSDTIFFGVDEGMPQSEKESDFWQDGEGGNYFEYYSSIVLTYTKQGDEIIADVEDANGFVLKDKAGIDEGTMILALPENIVGTYVLEVEGSEDVQHFVFPSEYTHVSVDRDLGQFGIGTLPDSANETVVKTANGEKRWISAGSGVVFSLDSGDVINENMRIVQREDGSYVWEYQDEDGVIQTFNSQQVQAAGCTLMGGIDLKGDVKSVKISFPSNLIKNVFDGQEIMGGCDDFEEKGFSAGEPDWLQSRLDGIGNLLKRVIKAKNPPIISSEGNRPGLSDEEKKRRKKLNRISAASRKKNRGK